METVFHKLCNVNDIKENQTIAVEIKGENILVARINNLFYAVENNCTHENMPLGEGEIFDGQIQCPHHGARFDVKNGKATQFPAVVDLKRYEIKIDNNNVMVAL